MSKKEIKGRKLFYRMVILKSLIESDTVSRQSGRTPVISMPSSFIMKKCMGGKSYILRLKGQGSS